MNVLIGIFIGTVGLQSIVGTVVARSPRRPDDCYCPAIFKPVCGDNDITYTSECALNCASIANERKGFPPISVAYTGECELMSCNCPKDNQPVCGSDGRTYLNKCELQCYNRRRQERNLYIIKIAYQGECATRSECPVVSMPVCGTDGRTYRNICYLQSQSRDNELIGLEPIYVDFLGPCRQDNCICATVTDPVCASNGKSYNNKCILGCENRRRRELGQPELTIRYEGRCNVESACTTDYNPVCGSDGNTYGNLCAFNNENLRRLREGLPLLLIDYYGECHDCFCSLQVDEVCGNDGVTYSNACFLRCENKKRANQNLPPITEVDC